MAASHSTSQDYNPPRFKWTKRIAWGSLGLGVLNVALWGSATLIAQHRLDKMIASYRAVGEPVYAEDFNVSKNIPDDENAATYYMKAVSVYRWPGIIDPSVNLERLFDAVRFGHGDEFAAEIDALISTNGEAIELVRRGAQCEDVDWGIDVSWPLFDCVLPSFGPRRDLVWLLGVAVEKSQTEGQHRRLIELLFAQVRLSDQVGQNPPVMIAHMLGNLCSTRACVTIEFVTPNLAVAGDDPVAVTGASQAQVRALINQLLDERAHSQSWATSLLMERAVSIDTVRIWCGGKPTVAGSMVQRLPGASILGPIWTIDGCRVAEFWTGVKEAYLQDKYPRAKAMCPDSLLVDDTNMLLRPSRMFAISMSRAAELHFRLFAIRRMAATALAIRLFEIDHGDRPESLDQLVPEYLESIPRDPFADGDQPIRYWPDGDPPLLYCVGKDGVDDGGRFELNEDGGVDMDKLDLVFFLNGDRPLRNP